MSLNCLEIDRILQELPLEGSFIQGIRQSGFTRILFDFYGRNGPFTLLISLHPGTLRLHQATLKYPSLKTPPRFLQLLRARVKGCRVKSAGQIGMDRIIRLELVRDQSTCLLYIRLWGGAANLILTDGQGVILDAFSRRPSRKEIPGESYQPEASTQKNPDFTAREPSGEGSYNRKIEALYHQKEHDEERERLTDKVRTVLESRERKLLSLIDNLSRKKDVSRNAEEAGKWGDLITASLHTIKKGDRWLETEDYSLPGTAVRIPLDPELSPHENAEKYYKRQKRLKTSRGLAEQEREQRIRELDRLRLEKKHLLEENPPLEELQAVLPVHTEKTGGDPEVPGLRFRSGPFPILVGRTAAENDSLLRHYVNGNDLWLHTRDYPGGYVFIKTLKGKSVPLDVLLDAGHLAVWYSKARQAGEAELYYTPVKYLRRAKNGPTGLVLPTREKNLSIKIDPARLKRIQEG